MTETQEEDATADTPTRGPAVQEFFWGASYPWRGLVFLRSQTSLWPWAAAPVLLTTFLIFGAGYLSYTLAPELLNAYWTRPQVWFLLVLWNLTAMLTILVVFGTSAIILYALSGLFCAPLYDRLSERTEQLIRPGEAEPFEFWIFVEDVFYSIFHSLLATLLWMALAIVLFFLNFFPVVGGLLDFVLTFLLTSWFLARETMDGIMCRRRMSFTEKLAVITSEVPAFTGFGAVTTVMIWIPFVNLVTFPVAIVGATMLFLQLEKDGRLPER